MKYDRKFFSTCKDYTIHYGFAWPEFCVHCDKKTGWEESPYRIKGFKSETVRDRIVFDKIFKTNVF
jgi:hypothetical protein